MAMKIVGAMPQNQPSVKSETDAGGGASVTRTGGIGNYRVTLPQDTNSSDSSSCPPKSPSPMSSGSPVHPYTTSIDVRSKVPDPIGSSLAWISTSAVGPSSSTTTPTPTPLSVSVSVPSPVPARSSVKVPAIAQIASKGGIRHSILGILGIPAEKDTQTLTKAVAVAAPIPMNVTSQGAPSPLQTDASSSIHNANTNTSVTLPMATMAASAKPNAPVTGTPAIATNTNKSSVSAMAIDTAMSTATTEQKKGARSFSFHLNEATTNYQKLSFASGGGQCQPNDGASASDRKQKRLQRNRESARLSRRRRKQYLEVLENRVNYLCEEMDRGRREHVLGALRDISLLRNGILQELEQGTDANSGRLQDDQELLQKVSILGNEGALSRTSRELMTVITFGREYLKSLVIPPSKKYIMWLTLQNDIFYRGGRAASERLSAARIGEKLRSCGHTHVPPSNGMWPLFCNEVALSYDQEERIRSLQKEVLGSQASWLHRHTGASSEHILQSSHDAIVRAAESTKKRGKTLMDVLTPKQKAKFIVWMAQKRKDNAQKVAALIASKFQKIKAVDDIKTDPQRHDAANLYILNHKLTVVANSCPSTNSMPLSAKALKKFARRPAFESLATVDDIKGPGHKRGRKMSGDSVGMKRCSSEISVDGLDSISEGRSFLKKSTSGTSLCGAASLTPEAAQVACSTHVYQALGSITNLIPSHRLVKQSATHFHHIQPTPVTSQVNVVRAHCTSPPVAALLPNNYSHERGFYDSHPHQTIAPAPVPSAPLNTTPEIPVSNNHVQQQYNTVQIPEPVSVLPMSNFNQRQFQHPAATCQPTLLTVASAPVLSDYQKVPSPLLQGEEQIHTESNVGGFVPFDDIGCWNVSNTLADESLFELTEEDWAIGEGALLEY